MTPDKIDTALLEATAGEWIIETDPPNTPTPQKRSYRHFVFIGTSGSYDYLRDSTGNQRFWLVDPRISVPVGPLTSHDAELLDKLLALTTDAPHALSKKM